MNAPNTPLLETTVNGVVTLTLNRPEVRNALNIEMLEALEDALIRLYRATDVRLVVLKGAGDAFMAGGDIKQFERNLQEQPVSHGFALMLARVNLIVQMMRDLRQPIIAAVHGACAGFGVSLALAADLIIAADSGKFTLAYDRLGLTPDGGASWHLAHTLGLKRASALVLLGDVIDAATAERWGLINAVVPEAELEATVEKAVMRLKAGSAAAQANGKRLLNYAGERMLSAQLEEEAESFAQLSNSDNFAEGVAAFLAKRAPNFKEN